MPASRATIIPMLTYTFVSPRGAALLRLRIPFPLTWRSERGFLRVLKSDTERTFGQSGSFFVPTEELFDSHILPDAHGSAAGQLVIAADFDHAGLACEPDWSSLRSVYARGSRGLGLALAQSMFKHPWYGWDIQLVAARLELTSKGLQTALFRDAYSYEAALRRCRRLHGMLERGHSGCFFTRVIEPEPARPTLR
ncbi:hypothetical protein A9R05_27220 [Burkholderia sp. KK1]|nr:hypothetical protein A9R05_27220 [Burkholderia sp. KK1]